MLALACYLAFAIGLIGLVWRVAIYLRTPQRLPIAVTPAPQGAGGVAWRLTREVVLFQSLFQSNKWTWFFGWVFHGSLLLVLLRHLRYFLEPVPSWVLMLQPFGRYAGISMALALAALLARRLLVPRVRFISTASDHAMLLLLMLIAASGLMMSFVLHTDIIAVKRFTLGLLSFESHALPGGPMTVHLLLVCALLAIFPISKLLHVPGLFLAPSRAMADHPRGAVPRPGEGS